MARKKQKKASKPKQTPNSYISSGKARLLPLGDCFINANWKEAGLANIVISRKHVTGNITYGVFLVDLLWKGVVDSDVRFNAPEEEIKELFGSEIELVPIDYNKAHNIIYGAEAFAADFDIKAHPDFALSRMILEEDDERIPIIDIEFGKDGKPFIIIRHLRIRSMTKTMMIITMTKTSMSKMSMMKMSMSKSNLRMTMSRMETRKIEMRIPRQTKRAPSTISGDMKS